MGREKRDEKGDKLLTESKERAPTVDRLDYMFWVITLDLKRPKGPHHRVSVDLHCPGLFM